MRIILTLIAVLSAACTDFDPRSLLQNPRVLGVVAAPPQLGPTDTLELDLIEYAPEPGTHRYTLCLVSIGVFADYACADERLEIQLEDTGPRLTVDLGPMGVDILGQLFEFIGEISAETAESDDDCGLACVGRDGTSRDYIDLQVKVDSQWAGGQSQTTVKTIRVQLSEAEPQTNPILKDMTIEGLNASDTASAGSALIVTVDPSDTVFETYVDSGGRSKTEELTFTWYSTQGEWDQPVTFGDASSSELQLPNTLDETPIEIFVVARDGRGGTAYLQQTVDVETP